MSAPQGRWNARLSYEDQLPEKCCGRCWWGSYEEGGDWAVCSNPHRVFNLVELMARDAPMTAREIDDEICNAAANNEIGGYSYGVCARFKAYDEERNHVFDFDSDSPENIAAFNAELAIAHAAAVACYDETMPLFGEALS